MRHRPARPSLRLLTAVLLATPFLWQQASGETSEVSSLRRTPLVRAVRNARPSIVNIHGQKTLDAQRDQFGEAEGPRRVNGMGTGVVIDERGYIVTNHHVVEGVRKIQVTMHDGKSYVAKLVERDSETDLAIIKINSPRRLQVIEIGKSDDLMPGEPVVAVGNAFGYEHTVTRGVISALHRSVKVSDEQKYEDLIQTDASINPGNSGGPLLNIEGRMIGINVAVRAGAQGIGFAIPVDSAMAVAADLLSVRRLENRWHGVRMERTSRSEKGLVVGRVDDGSPADLAGIQPGDVIVSVGEHKVSRSLDFERALLGRSKREEVPVNLRRGERTVAVPMVLETLARKPRSVETQAWDMLGFRLSPVPAKQFRRESKYRGGLLVTAVRSESQASHEGIRRGDILVGMHTWETKSWEDLAYIMKQADRADEPLKFYILRGVQPLFGHLRLAERGR